MPSPPTSLPTKKVSTMLYSSLTSIDKITGIENLKSNLLIFSTPNSLLLIIKPPVDIYIYYHPGGIKLFTGLGSISDCFGQMGKMSFLQKLKIVHEFYGF